MLSLSRTLFVILCLLGIGVKSSFAQGGPTVSVSAVQIGVPGQVGALNVTTTWAGAPGIGVALEVKLSQCTIVNGQVVIPNPAIIYRRTIRANTQNGTLSLPFTGMVSGMNLSTTVQMLAPNGVVLAQNTIFPVLVP